MPEINPAEVSAILKQQLSSFDSAVELAEVGTVLSVGDGIARVYGLDNAQYGELVEFSNGLEGMVQNLEEDNVGIVLFGTSTGIKEGDTVNIDYVGKKDGKKFDGGSAEGYDLEIGSGSFIDGFEDGLIGKKIGDKVKLELTFPEDYGEASLAGQDVVFNVTINSATRMTVPEYDLANVKNTTEYDSIAAYEKAVEKENYKEKEAEEMYLGSAWRPERRKVVMRPIGVLYNEEREVK